MARESVSFAFVHQYQPTLDPVSRPDRGRFGRGRHYLTTPKTDYCEVAPPTARPDLSSISSAHTLGFS